MSNDNRYRPLTIWLWGTVTVFPVAATAWTWLEWGNVISIDPLFFWLQAVLATARLALCAAPLFFLAVLLGPRTTRTLIVIIGLGLIAILMVAIAGLLILIAE